MDSIVASQEEGPRSAWVFSRFCDFPLTVQRQVDLEGYRGTDYSKGVNVRINGCLYSR